MTNEQIDDLLKEIGRAPFLTSEEELSLLKAVKERGRDCNEMKRLEKGYMRIVINLINQYKNRGLPLEELIEVAKVSLRNAAESYGTHSGIKFITHAVTHMRQGIEQAITEEKPSPIG